MLEVCLLHNHETLEIRMNSTWLDMCTYCNVRIKTWSITGIKSMEAMIEQIIEAFMNGISLVHYDSMTLSS